MKKLIKSTSYIIMILTLLVSTVIPFSAAEINNDQTTDNEIILATKSITINVPVAETASRAVPTGNINITYTISYSESAGVKAYITVEKAWYELGNPKFTSINGIVTVDTDETYANKSFNKTVSETSSISHTVSTGIKLESGESGTVEIDLTVRGSNIAGGYFSVTLSEDIEMP